MAAYNLAAAVFVAEYGLIPRLLSSLFLHNVVLECSGLQEGFYEERVC
jgi:hypothetical protein